MSLSIEQWASYAGFEGEDRWEWSVWIDGRDDELDRIEYVEWVLHPTFPNPIRHIDDRRTQFRLNGSGWGVFTIRARVHEADGGTTTLSHMLSFDTPGRQSTSKVVPKIFIVGGYNDFELIVSAQAVLEELGADVSTSQEMTGGENFESWLERAIADSDTVLVLLTGSAAKSKWVGLEVDVARRYGKRIVPVLFESVRELPGSLADLQAIHVDPSEDRVEAFRSIAAALRAESA